MTNQSSDGKKLILIATPDTARKLLVDSEYYRLLAPFSGSSEFTSKAINAMSKVPLGPASTIGKLIFERRRLSELRRMKTEDVVKKIQQEFDFSLPITRIEPDSASRTLKLGVGHIPKDGSFYLQHPIYPNLYLEPSEYQRAICAEKDAAFQKLAASLGAKSIKLDSVQVHEKRSFFGGKGTANKLAAELGLSFNIERDGSIQKQIVKTFQRPKFEAPFVPQELADWVQFDPDFRTMAHDRLEANVTLSKVRLEFSQNLGFGGEIVAKLASKGISLGASHKQISRSVWFFEVEYFDLDPVSKG